MISLFKNLFASMPPGPRYWILIYLSSFPLEWLLNKAAGFSLVQWLALEPVHVWQGQFWRPLTYGLMAAGPVEWVINGFWLLTMASVLGRAWSSLEFWIYCLVGSIAGAAVAVLLKLPIVLNGAWAVIFALLVAWDFFYRNERVILLGLGEVSVRQAVILIAVIDSVICFFSCGGWILLISLWCGGLGGWLYLMARCRTAVRGKAQAVRSERAIRLEL